MESLLSEWLTQQAPIVVVLVIGFVALWRQNNQQQIYLRDLLDRCWDKLTDCLEDDANDHDQNN